MIRVGIIGATGYTGAELIRILLRHPEAQITVLARSEGGETVPIEHLYPGLAGLIRMDCEPLNVEKAAKETDCVFLCLPHGAAMETAAAFRKQDKVVIDLSADFRLSDLSTYEKWYGPHTQREHLEEAVYGLPELYRSTIKKARLIANPGCYPTASTLPLYPLLKTGLVSSKGIIIDAKSGTTGAGKKLAPHLHATSVMNNFMAYGVGKHRHTPEIEQVLSHAAGEEITLQFTPHLLPVARGILATVYAKIKGNRREDEFIRALHEAYEPEPFVRVLPKGEFPDLARVRGSNYCDIGVSVDTRTGNVILISAIDNMVKGASGQAVQNMNIVYNLDEGLALTEAPLPF